MKIVILYFLYVRVHLLIKHQGSLKLWSIQSLSSSNYNVIVRASVINLQVYILILPARLQLANHPVFVRTAILRQRGAEPS